MLTDAIMEQEAQQVAEGIMDIIQAGAQRGQSVMSRITILLGRGLALFGDVDEGLDDDANEARFVLEVMAKAMDMAISKYLPLTKDSEE